MNRREMLRRTGAAAVTLSLPAWPLGWTAPADAPKRRILMFSRSEGFEHDVVKRRGDKLSLAETLVTELGAKHGFEVECTKDGRVFVPENLAKYDGFLFETQGDLLKVKSRDDQPPMLPEGKKALLQAIASGKGFVGSHCASDTFHTPGPKFQNQPREQLDPYIAMIGGEFIRHGQQQRARMHVIDKNFPGFKDQEDFDVHEEWYSLKNFAPDLHVLLVQETTGMKGLDYERPNFPATWARLHEKGRVFYTSLGHRDDVWTNPLFHQILLGALAWSVGNVDADVLPNLQKAAPQASVLPKEPPPQKK
jgi:type 1 glutamine amidotransferase